MRRLKGVLAIVVFEVAMLAFEANAVVSAATLDFEGLPFTFISVGGPLVPNPSSVLTTDYQSLGVLFGRPGVSTGVAVVRDSFAPSSGLNSVAGLDAAGIIPGLAGTAAGDIYFSFVVPGSQTPGFTDSLSFTIGDSGGDLDSFQIRSYNLGGALIDSRNVSGTSRFGVNIDAPGIHRVEIDFLPADYGYSMDDLKFVTPVPEPSTLVLLGVGALGLLARAWRGRRKLHKLSSTILAAAVVVSAVSQGRAGVLYVTSYDGNRLLSVDTATGASTALVSSGLTTPHNIVFAPDGSLFIADRGNKAVKRYAIGSGTLTTFISADSSTDPSGLAFTLDGQSLFVANQSQASIFKYDVVNGSHTTFATGVGTNPAPMILSRDGSSLYVGTTDSILRYNVGTGAATVFASFPSSSVSRPSGFAFAPDGGLFVALQNANSIRRFDTDTGASTVFASGGNLSAPEGLAFSADGRTLYVCNYYGDSIFQYDVATGSHTVLASGGLLSGPLGLALQPAVPEPSTLVLLGVGAIGLLAWAWRRRRSERQCKTFAASGLHLERKGYTMLNRILAVVALSAMFPVGAAMATPITLSDLNATATFDFAGGGSGMTDWTVDGVGQLRQQWFWYRIGNTGPELPINSLTLDGVKVSDGNRNPGNDRVVAYYSGSGLDVSLDHALTGGRPGTGVSDVAETITIKNTTLSAIDFHFFQFVDLNLMNTPQDTWVQIIPTGHAAKQTEGNYAVAETVDTPPPSRYQADYAANIRTLLTNGGPDDLNNQASAANGDLGWAFQWDVSLAPGQDFLISKDKRLGFVPEPGTLVLLAAGLLGLLAYAWRRRWKLHALRLLIVRQGCAVLTRSRGIGSH